MDIIFKLGLIILSSASLSREKTLTLVLPYQTVMPNNATSVRVVLGQPTSNKLSRNINFSPSDSSGHILLINFKKFTIPEHEGVCPRFGLIILTDDVDSDYVSVYGTCKDSRPTQTWAVVNATLAKLEITDLSPGFAGQAGTLELLLNMAWRPPCQLGTKLCSNLTTMFQEDTNLNITELCVDEEASIDGFEECSSFTPYIITTPQAKIEIESNYNPIILLIFSLLAIVIFIIQILICFQWAFKPETEQQTLVVFEEKTEMKPPIITIDQ